MKVKVVRMPGDQEVLAALESERAWTSSKCVHCRKERTLVYLLPHRKSSMRVCENRECYLFCDLNKLHSWQK